MILREWIPPDQRFNATDDEGKEYEHICHGPEEDLEKRLIAKGLTVNWIRPEPFSMWQTRAANATRHAIKQYKDGVKTIEFRGTVWSDLKWHLFELFNDKCAYCESKVRLTDRGDVEHYRPKGKVDEDPAHPGYFWLAYYEMNLLPSCKLCNQEGKKTHFPVEGSHSRDNYMWTPEKPLLLNPYNESIDPFEHLEFESLGKVKARLGSKIGEHSRTCYGLNRSGLPKQRHETVAQVKKDLYAGVFQQNSFEDSYTSLHNRIILGDREYSLAQRWELERITRDLGTFIQGLPLRV